MPLHTTLLKKIHVAALLALIVVLLALIVVANSQSPTCPNNQYLRETTQTVANQGGGAGYNIISCVECPWPKYGTGGVCYDCPSFTRTRKTKDTSGTLWCTNDCNEIIKNEKNNDVQNLADAKHWGRGVFQFSGEKPTCKLCADDKFEAKHKAGIVLTNFKNEIINMQFKQNDIDKLIQDKDRLSHFIWTICSSCPPGFVKDVWAAPAGSSITVREGEMIPCRSCSINEGVQKGPKCEQCNDNEWQELKLQSFLPYKSTVLYDGGLNFIYATAFVAQTCLSCPSGTQKLKTFESKGEWSFLNLKYYCRGKEAADCCTDCPVNKYRGDVQQKCESVASKQVAIIGNNFAETRATSQRPCGSGERLAVCFDGMHCVYQITANWKTCLPCSLDETMRSSDTTGCIACSTEKKDRVDPKDGKKCISCSQCDELTITETEDYPLKSLPGFSLVTNPYTVLKVNADCTPLSRRKISKTGSEIQISGADHYRPDGETRGIVIPVFHFLDRAQGLCELKHCKQACAARFQYSNGCGISTATSNTWVKSPNFEFLKISSLNANTVLDATKWEVLTNGNCQFCTACDAGYYNDGCNQNYESFPEGKCKACKTQCAPNFFLSHPEQDAGCHDPPWSQNSTDASNKFQILEDYTCVRCPTWVRRGKKIYVVSACGRHNLGDTYQHFDSEMQGSQLLKKLYPVQIELDSSTKIAGVERGNFRTFVNNLKPYCPPEFFFDVKVPTCNFVNEGFTFELPNKTRVDIGYDDYNPLCCKKCTVCMPPTKKKDIDSWKPCTGDTDEDVQNKCVDKCVLGYWQDGDQQCKRCSTCYDGILPSP